MSGQKLRICDCVGVWGEDTFKIDSWNGSSLYWTVERKDGGEYIQKAIQGVRIGIEFEYPFFNEPPDLIDFVEEYDIVFSRGFDRSGGVELRFCFDVFNIDQLQTIIKNIMQISPERLYTDEDGRILPGVHVHVSPFNLFFVFNNQHEWWRKIERLIVKHPLIRIKYERAGWGDKYGKLHTDSWDFSNRCGLNLTLERGLELRYFPAVSVLGCNRAEGEQNLLFFILLSIGIASLHGCENINNLDDLVAVGKETLNGGRRLYKVEAFDDSAVCFEPVKIFRGYSEFHIFNHTNNYLIDYNWNMYGPVSMTDEVVEPSYIRSRIISERDCIRLNDTFGRYLYAGFLDKNEVALWRGCLEYQRAFNKFVFGDGSVVYLSRVTLKNEQLIRPDIAVEFEHISADDEDFIRKKLTDHDGKNFYRRDGRCVVSWQVPYMTASPFSDIVRIGNMTGRLCGVCYDKYLTKAGVGRILSVTRDGGGVIVCCSFDEQPDRLNIIPGGDFGGLKDATVHIGDVLCSKNDINSDEFVWRFYMLNIAGVVVPVEFVSRRYWTEGELLYIEVVI